MVSQECHIIWDGDECLWRILSEKGEREEVRFEDFIVRMIGLCVDKDTQVDNLIDMELRIGKEINEDHIKKP